MPHYPNGGYAGDRAMLMNAQDGMSATTRLIIAAMERLGEVA